MNLDIETLNSCFVKRYRARVLELNSSSEDNARKIIPSKRAIKSIKNVEQFVFYDDPW